MLWVIKLSLIEEEINSSHYGIDDSKIFNLRDASINLNDIDPIFYECEEMCKNFGEMTPLESIVHKSSFCHWTFPNGIALWNPYIISFNDIRSDFELICGFGKKDALMRSFDREIREIKIKMICNI